LKSSTWLPTYLSYYLYIYTLCSCMPWGVIAHSCGKPLCNKFFFFFSGLSGYSVVLITSIQTHTLISSLGSLLLIFTELSSNGNYTRDRLLSRGKLYLLSIELWNLNHHVYFTQVSWPVMFSPCIFQSNQLSEYSNCYVGFHLIILW